MSLSEAGGCPTPPLTELGVALEFRCRSLIVVSLLRAKRPSLASHHRRENDRFDQRMPTFTGFRGDSDRWPLCDTSRRTQFAMPETGDFAERYSRIPCRA